MDVILTKVFMHRRVNMDKLYRYGFAQNQGDFSWHTSFADGQLELVVSVSNSGEVATCVTDLATGEPFTLFLVESATGAFVGEVRGEYERILDDIAKKCFDEVIFKSDNAQRAIEYIRIQYGCELEFLWENLADVAVCRRTDNTRWFCIFFTLSKRKLGIDSDDLIDILDLRIAIDELDAVVDNQRYFKGYHMNKKHWVSVALDGSVSNDEICRRIDESYILAKQ